MKNKCYICDISREVFEKDAKSFENHVRYEHNLWNYLYYIVFLKSKPKLDYNGTESYIYKKIKSDDLSWFPMNRAMSLSDSGGDDENDDVKKLIEEKLSQFEGRICAAFGISATK